uniref:Uncharacterized protein n=1 Tax=Anguilla anguilla TaxID=7936 RepID=A0A0E9WGH2_ANGAN
MVVADYLYRKRSGELPCCLRIHLANVTFSLRNAAHSLKFHLCIMALDCDKLA